MNWQSEDDSDVYDDFDDELDDDLADEDSDLVDCPECGRGIYEYSERCPYCESYVSLTASRQGVAGRPRIAFSAIVYLLIAALLIPFLLVLLRILG